MHAPGIPSRWQGRARARARRRRRWRERSVSLSFVSSRRMPTRGRIWRDEFRIDDAAGSNAIKSGYCILLPCAPCARSMVSSQAAFRLLATRRPAANGRLGATRCCASTEPMGTKRSKSRLPEDLVSRESEGVSLHDVTLFVAKKPRLRDVSSDAFSTTLLGRLDRNPESSGEHYFIFLCDH